MTTATPRDRLHELVDRLPESEWSAAERMLQLLYLKTIKPVDDEPLTDEDRDAVAAAREEFAQGEGLSQEDVMRELRQSS